MPRASWTGTLALGQVRIPVKLYPAIQDAAPAFRLLHRPCHTPIEQVRRCPHCRTEATDVVRGREIAAGRYAPVEAADLGAAAAEAGELARQEGGANPEGPSAGIEVLNTILAGHAPLEHADKSYWIAPQRSAAKAYAVLWAAAHDPERDLLVRATLRDRPRIGLVHAPRSGSDAALFLLTFLHYAAEATAPPPGPPPLGAHDPHVALCRRLLRRLDGDVDFGRFHDVYAVALEKILTKRLAALPAAAGGSADLADQLEASLAT